MVDTFEIKATRYTINPLFGGIEVWVDRGWGWQWVRTFTMV